MRAGKPVGKAFLTAAVLVVLTLSLGGTSASKGVDRTATYEQLKLFTDVLSIIQNQYVDETEPKEVIYGTFVTDKAYTTCFTGVVVPYVCTSGSKVCGN